MKNLLGQAFINNSIDVIIIIYFLNLPSLISWFFFSYWKRQIRRSSEIAARRRIAANDQKKFTKNYIFET